MDIKGWRYYNHAAIPLTPPHEEPNLLPLEDNSIWNIEGRTPLLARWTREFDCGYETNWWYVIKDTPFDISSLKAKRRYEINKGIKNFEVCEINASDYKHELYHVVESAWAIYPEKYRPKLDYDAFLKDVDNWNYYKVYAAFQKETQKLCGYAILKRKDLYIDFCVLKSIPEYEHFGVNAAMCYQIVMDHNSFFEDGGYICDGARNIVHETDFQNYLIKYFEFRRAYCHLELAFNPTVKWLVKLSYPFRGVIRKLGWCKWASQLASVLNMEEIRREGTVQ